ncbi:hypothetical protein LSAT2_026428 [Lamellibrachia satsuma]|nr:hypothetical protein LSAT2_026428 [Lamellibrachia satsuma]
MAEKLTNEDGTPELEFCKEHQGNIADMYCIKCTTGVCSLCLCHGKGQHVGHVVTILEEWCSRLKKEAIQVEDDGEELANTVEEIISDVTKCGQDVEVLNTDYGNKIKMDYERVLKVLEEWGNKAVQTISREATNMPYPQELYQQQQKIRKLCDAAQSLDFPSKLREMETGKEKLEELQQRLCGYKTQYRVPKQDLRTSSPDTVVLPPLMASDKHTVLGVPKQDLRTSSPDTVVLPPLTASNKHTVLNAMLSYNGDNKDMQKVDGLQNFLHNVLDNEERAVFFDKVLPKDG